MSEELKNILDKLDELLPSKKNEDEYEFKEKEKFTPEEIEEANKSERVQKIKILLDEINFLTRYEIHPKINDDIIFYFLIIKRDEKNDEDKWSKEAEEKLNELVDCVCNNKKGFYKELVDFGYKKLDEYTKRQKMHEIYKTKVIAKNVDGKEFEISIYDMSNLKYQVDHNYYKDTDILFKNPPDYIKDIKRFDKLVIPLDLSTVYLLNIEEKVVLDLRKEEVFNLYN
jgi:hypothetical protein